MECLFGKVLDLFKTKKGKELTTNSTINTNFLSDGPLSVELIQSKLFLIFLLFKLKFFF